MSEERFVVDVTIAAPVDAVWRALREPEEIRRWHGWHFDGLDKEIEVIYQENVTESAAERWLELQGKDRFELTDLGETTRLRLTRAPKGDNPDWDAYYDDINEGWITFLHQLRFALERHPAADRRTVFSSGTAPADVFDLAGLTAVADLPPGTPYAAGGLTGEIWYRSANQLGVTVAEWGDGLLVAGRGSGGNAMLVLTTYGLDDPTFAGLEARWGSLLSG
ncbi:hypothetical protein Aph01nite_51510 [Acrocarpospora phusangensis]|uniref:Activator of HSP90 ATPase n=1 Tax=Acrocarpospora phusangensis TaxID=1070424 RepID=A0A919QF98_9ACTN|nr:SRPBCC domain-containing protein [Acrocarpospora phusangensis]GIH26841.1 hypothetical protein Aph01nite_51510 [Acrocarpospora phusangensis]